MKRYIKILVIFFISIIISILIYNKFHIENNNILVITDTKLNISNAYQIHIDNLDYDKLNKYIYYNKKLYYKGKYIRINEIINDNKYLIINLNKDIDTKCTKSNISKYIDIHNSSISKTLEKLSKININIIIINNKCNKNNNYYKFDNVEFYDLETLKSNKMLDLD